MTVASSSFCGWRFRLANDRHVDLEVLLTIRTVVGLAVVITGLSCECGEILYNGIELPDQWPPREPGNPREGAYETDYLEHPPAVIPIDVGRQLFVDDFLIGSSSNLVRKFFKPVKYAGNPVMWPQTDLERQASESARRGYRQAPYAGTVGGGVWWDPRRRVFRMWYESGWMNALCYAESADGLDWKRPELDIVKGTNKLFVHDRLDSWSVYPDYAAADPYANWKLLISPPGSPRANLLYASSDGVHWKSLGVSGESDDRTTMFYNPFRGKWVYSLRGGGPGGFGRNRAYWESTTFGQEAYWSWSSQHDRPEDASLPRAYAWLSTDKRDVPDPVIGRPPQLYNVDAVAYESIMLGLFELHLGPENGDCLKRGLPKITDIHFAYSRDGYHFSRPDRTAAIAASRWGSGAWDTGYIQPVSSGCVIKDERLWFYYSGIRGDETAAGPLVKDNWRRNGMHFNGGMGVATLRRDGFAGLVSDGAGTLVTRPVRFSGHELFVNADCRYGEVQVDVLDEAGGQVLKSLPAVKGDGTKLAVGTVAAFAGRPVRLRFNLKCGVLYAFWVSPSDRGESNGWLAGGGPAYSGLCDR